jgi:hypothetical protein
VCCWAGSAGNWRAALEDSQAVLALQPDNLKALFRGARAAAKLGQWEVCQGLISRGLQADPGAPELVALHQVGRLAPAEQQPTWYLHCWTC